MSTEPIAQGIFRLKVPFEELYTSVFFVQCGEEWAIIDCATTECDVDFYILPATERLQGNVTHLLLTHGHGDHAGGAERMLAHLPELCLGTAENWTRTPYRPIADGEILLNRLQVVYLPGHSRRSVGYFDLPTKTLISGDCLQLAGVGKYVHGIAYPEQYIASLDRLRDMPIKRIVASHDYEPLGYLAEGVDAVARYLDECERICKEKYLK